MAEPEVVPDGVGHVAGQQVGLERVDVDADADRPVRADPPDAGHRGLAAGELTTPAGAHMMMMLSMLARITRRNLTRF